MPRQRKEPDTDRYSGRLSKRLRDLRDERGLTVDQLAAKISRAGYSVSTPTLYAWESGRIQVQLDALPYVAKTFGLTLAEFLPAK